MTRQGVIDAMRDTLALAVGDVRLDQDRKQPCSFSHLCDMYVQMKAPEFSEGKLHRWLGWAQGVLVARGIATLDEVKGVSKRYAETP